MEHEVAVSERAAFGVLARETNGNPILEQGGVGESLALAPVDPAVDDGLVTAVELLRELGIDREPGRNVQQLLVQSAQAVGCNGRHDSISRRRDGDASVTVGAGGV